LSGDAVGLLVGALELLWYAAALGELIAVLATPGADLLALLRRRLGDHGILVLARCRLPAGFEVCRQSLFELLLLVWCQVYLVPGISQAEYDVACMRCAAQIVLVVYPNKHTSHDSESDMWDKEVAR